MRAQEFVTEKWSKKYKSSINCANPKGFSQRAHCQGRKKNEDVQIDERTADYVRRVMNSTADVMKFRGYRAVGQLNDRDLEKVAQRAESSLHDVQIILGMDHIHKQLAEFVSSNGGDDGFSDDTLQRLAAQWWQGDEDPRVEQILAAAGWEIGQDEGYDNGGAFVVQAGDENGHSYMSWPAEELESQQLDELMFKGSQCTKDCSGHMAGYEWSIRKAGKVPNSHSPSFNKGAAIQRSGL